ncbi:MAG TPA: anaerobic glycerol-3-phosphate dehydrogenase subunit C [Syntrophobacteria bacterium]|nr:anaerobic glycerol-3-phosphate dehydrogenase subunit C [Syntrophobacteria bacterium]
MTHDIFRELREAISGEVHTDPLRRYLLSTDGSIFRVQPACVVYPRAAADVVHTVRFARSHSLTVHPRGAGSGLCGAALGTGVIIDFTKYMHRLVRLDLRERTFECEPGFRWGELEQTLQGSGLFFPPDPSSGEFATFGGMYGTNASGAHSVKYGTVADYILDADVVLSSGEVITLSEVRARGLDELPAYLRRLAALYDEHRVTIEVAYPKPPSNVCGYNLRGLVRDGRLDLSRLFAGSEGTLGIVTRLKLRLLERPRYDSLVVAFFGDTLSSVHAVQRALELGPSGIEIMDKSLLALARERDENLREEIPEGVDNVLLIEFDGTDAESCNRLAGETTRMLKSEGFTGDVHLAVTKADKERFWAVRKAAVPMLYRLKGEKKILALVEDASVPIPAMADYVQGLYRIMDAHQVRFVLYGHIARGLLHTRPLLNLKASDDIDLLRVLADETFELVHSLGGSVSGEHGDGRLRSAYVKRQYPGIYDLFLAAKGLLDGDDMLNPEIKTRHDPEQMQRVLRFGKGYQSTGLRDKYLHWPEGFDGEVEKCHGCSKCTTITTATRMCPIYKVTRDEAATPKAKANLLRALLSGAVEGKSLYERAFREVIETCVNCGSCYRECPSQVNIPKMALEARAHHGKRFGTSLENQLLGNLERTGKAWKYLPRPLSALLDLGAAREAMELVAGISAKRKPPVFARRSLFEQARYQEGRGEPTVLYFAGCYASYLRPEIGLAALRILKSMGLTTLVPPQHCCGLPMVSKGMVTEARERVEKNLRRWSLLARRADYITVTCSSCGLALMEEWSYLSDRDEVKAIRGKVLHISDLINRHFDRLKVEDSSVRLSYHNPCHLKVQSRPESSLHLLSQLPGVAVEDLRAHCCGMAGSWGMAARNYDLSRAIGSDLIGKLDRSSSTFGVTDCPTCRMQIEEFSPKPVRHPVEIIAERLVT